MIISSEVSTNSQRLMPVEAEGEADIGPARRVGRVPPQERPELPVRPDEGELRALDLGMEAASRIRLSASVASAKPSAIDRASLVVAPAASEPGPRSRASGGRP